MSRPSRTPGFSLLELLVTMSLTAVIAGAVLSMLVGGAGAGARGQERLAALTVVRAAADLLARDAAAACAGLEGAEGAVRAGGVVGCLQLQPPRGVRLILAEGEAVEVEATSRPGRYRLAERAAWRRGDRVVALGVLPEGAPAPPAIVPLGTVRRVIRPRRRASPRTGVAEVVFSAAEAALVRAAPARALVRVRVREYRAVAGSGGVSLRRRDDGSRWLPVLDGLTSLVFLDGSDGGPARAVVRAGRGADGVEAVAWLEPGPARVSLTAGGVREAPPARMP